MLTACQEYVDAGACDTFVMADKGKVVYGKKFCLVDGKVIAQCDGGALSKTIVDLVNLMPDSLLRWKISKVIIKISKKT